MAVGLKIRQGAGGSAIQIDSSYQNLQFIAKGTLTFSSPTPQNIPNTAGRTNTLLALRPSTYLHAVEKTTSGGFNVYREFQTGDQVNNTCDWFMFADPLTNELSGGVGLKIKKANGQTVFNSRFNYLRVLAMRDVSIPTGAVVSGSHPGKVIAIAQCLRPWSLYEQSFTVQGINRLAVEVGYGGSILTSASSYNLSMMRAKAAGGVGGGGSGTTFFEQPAGTFIIVDVTGY